MSTPIIEIRHNASDPDEMAGVSAFLADLYNNHGMLPVYRYDQTDLPLLQGEMGKIYGCRILLGKTPLPPSPQTGPCAHPKAHSDTFSMIPCPDCNELVPT